MFDGMHLKSFLVRWCAACVVATIMLVAWESGFYMALITQNRRDIFSSETEARVVPRHHHSEPENLKAVAERVQSERRALLDSECGRLDLSTSVSSYTMRHMFVIEKYKLVYNFIPKVGCSNWKRVMMVLDQQTDSVDDLTSDEVHINSKFRFLSSYASRARTKILNNYQKFLFVRHPFERLLSIFKNKLENLENYRHKPAFHKFGKEIVKSWRPGASEAALATGENVTWPEFVKYLTHAERRQKLERDFYTSDHWREMYIIASPCALKDSFIGHLETVAGDSKYLLEKWRAPANVRYLGAETSRPTNSSERSLYEAYFTQLPKEDLEKLWDIYKYDFQLFGYPKPRFIP